MKPVNDTIAALATPSGVGGVAVVRVSGPQVAQIAEQVTGGLPEPRRATLRTVVDAQGEKVDVALLLYFPAPHSFTGEDVLEIQGHGGVVVADLVLQAVLSRGARLAQPGEFSQRAFLNERMDLVKAEAIADLIEAGSAQAARSALRSLSGEFSHRIERLLAALIKLRVYVEAAIDFPEEEIDFLGDGRISSDLSTIQANLKRITESASQGRILRDGIQVVIVGAPNSGKSSLLNRLAGYDAAIVTPIPGTTRDVLRERISLKGVPIHLVDTAGMRDSDDPVEREGIRRAEQEMVSADHLLLILDDTNGDETHIDKLRSIGSEFHGMITRIKNKVDITSQIYGFVEDSVGSAIGISAKTGDGIEVLAEHLVTSAGLHGASEGLFSARRRHIVALERCAAALQRGSDALKAEQAGELLAFELREAQDVLGEITGEFTSDDLLGEIFSSFCIGK